MSTPKYSAACGLILCFFVHLVGSLALQAQPSAGDLDLRVAGVKIKVTDMNQALAFYKDMLGFAVLSDEHAPRLVTLQTNQWPLVLEQAKHPSPIGFPSAAQTSLTLQASDLLSLMEQMKNQGVVFTPRSALTLWRESRRRSAWPFNQVHGSIR